MTISNSRLMCGALSGLLCCGSLLSLLATHTALAQSANCYPSSGTNNVVIGSGSGDIGSALTTALGNASTGDHILIKAGTYTGGAVTIDKLGTSAAPIVIRPESGIGSVTINGATWTWANSCDWLVLEGMFFNSSHLELNGDHNRITRCRFRAMLNDPAIRVGNGSNPYTRGARDCRIDHCDFSTAWTTSQVPRAAIAIRPVQFKLNPVLSARLLIDHCDFHDLTYSGTTKYDIETITTYTTPNAMDLPRGETVTLERCRFSNIHINGQGEIVTVKMGGWITRFCTFDNIGTYYSHRTSGDSEIRSSWFELMSGTSAVSNWGPDHLIIGNRFIGSMRVDASAGNAAWSEVLNNIGTGNMAGTGNGSCSGSFGYCGAPQYSPSVNNVFIGNRLGTAQIRVGGYWGSESQNDPVAFPAANNLFEANTQDAGGDAVLQLSSIHGMTPAHTGTTVNATTGYYYVPAVKLAASGVGLYAPDPFCSGFPPVAHWTFNETSGTTAADSSGNANTGTVTAGTWTAGQIGNGLSFNGTTSIVSALSEAALDNLPAITVAAWIKPDTMGEGGKGRIVVKGAGNGPTAGWHFLLDGTNALAFVVDYDGAANLARFSANDAIGTSFGLWKHVVVTWTGSATATNVKFYVDGVETSYGTTTDGVGSRVPDGGSTFYLGNSSTLDRTFDGMLDDVRVYNYALSAAQVQTLFQTGGLVSPTGLTATAVAYNQINLAWTDVASESGYKVERKKGTGGTYAEIGLTVAGATTYNDTTAGTGTTYYYRVRAYNSAGNSGYSNEAGATTPEIADRKGHWKFNETTGTSAADSSGSGNTGALSGFSGTYWVAGKIDNALTFDGSNDIVNTGSGSSLDNLPAITVSAWINASSMGGGGKGRIVVKGAGNGPTAGWHFLLDNTRALAFVVDYDGAANLARFSANDAIGATFGVWKHVVVTWTGSATATNVKFYVDDVEVTYGTTTNGAGNRVNDNLSTFYLGNGSLLDRTFHGMLDDVRVYNRVLSAAEITALRRAGL